MSSMTGPLISVVLPVYNGERHLAETIESVLTQTYDPFELVIVDDGSTDGSAEVAGRYLSSRVRLVRQANGGTACARNAGVAAARGSLLAHLDADDVWLPESLAARAAALAPDGGADAACGRSEEFFSPEVPEDERARIRRLRDPITALIADAILVRRAAFDRVGPYDASMRAGQDLDWLLRAREAGLRFVAVPDLVVRRRIHSGNKGRAQPELARLRCRILKQSLDRRRASAGNT
jgi:glycosyltransferase involved in cell wall biosynthesis